MVRHTPVGQLEQLVGGAGAELGRLLPALHDRVPGLTEPLGAEPDSARYRLFEAATNFVSALAANGPLVLILDDLHWADKPTLLLLHHLLRTWSSGGLLIVGTYRDTDLDRRHPLSDTLADLRRLLQFERVAVTGLGEEEISAFLMRLSGQDPPPTLVKSLHDQTEGNPFYVGEVLRNFVESGAVTRVDDEWVVQVEVDSLGIPEGVKEVVGHRLTRLSADANAALAVAAIAGATSIPTSSPGSPTSTTSACSRPSRKRCRPGS